MAILPNLTNLTSTLEYSKHTTRGKTELTIEPNNKTKDKLSQKGLNKDYILEYNYGKGELLSLLIPNARGGNNDYLGSDEKAIENVDEDYVEQVSQMDRYWEDKRMSGELFILEPSCLFSAFLVFFFIKTQ